MKYLNTLKHWIEDDQQLMKQLRCVHELGIKDACIGAGAIRNLVWDQLHGYSERTPLNDVDVVYFDADNLSATQEKNYLATLNFLEPSTTWEVVNQARVHQWYDPTMPANESLEKGIAKWPETATCIGAYLNSEGIQIIAPFGIRDLFELKLRRNPACMDSTAFIRRLKEKQFMQHWPRVELYEPIAEQQVAEFVDELA